MNLPDQIPAAKRILALVDDYEQFPNVQTRSALRAAILDELEACAAQERERCAQYLRNAAERLAPEGKRTNQVDRHVAHVLTSKADDIAQGNPQEDE